MLDWVRSGAQEDRIASVMLRGFEKYRDAVKRIFAGDIVPYSGIVQTAEGSYEGEVIEKACYRRGGLVFLYKSYAAADVLEDQFPTQLFIRLIENLFRGYLAEIGYGAYDRLWMDACWAVCQRSGDYGTLHNHLPLDYDGHARFSGILYLSMPHSITPSTFPNGCLHIVAGESVLYFPPVPGTALFWPSKLLHGIHPFRGRGDRLAIAFDVAVS
ncbi:MAG TPA: putative 2OG-Fe(II) oxygenase [Geminicoccaceae bacterium]|nr:putative 2OG-Fe(II) oxygenase [Geminicoccaceae bacterium]